MNSFWSHADLSGGPTTCWPWMGTKNQKGYGIAWLSHKKRTVAHRVAYELTRGPIPEGLQLDHLCRNRACVNPLHLEIVTNRENVRRGVSSAAQRARQTHCKKGHPFDEANTLRWPSAPGHRICRTCHNIRNTKYREGVRALGELRP